MTSYDKNTPQSIQAMFDDIAKRYDRANAILSFNMHKMWNRKLVDAVMQQNTTLLDLCAGTGDIAFTYMKRSQTPVKMILLDFSLEMLQCARRKARHYGFSQDAIKYLQADAQEIPLEDSSVGSVSIAYGIRNVQDPERCIRDVHRVLEPGGRFGILELTEPSHPLLRMGHQIYLRTFLPTIGRWFCSNREAYQYLSSSIKAFYPPVKLVEIMEDCGFEGVSSQPLTGGIATLITATKK